MKLYITYTAENPYFTADIKPLLDLSSFYRSSQIQTPQSLAK